MIIDLTHTFTDDMPVYPGDVPSSLKPCLCFHEDGWNTSELRTGLHVGTHIDAPFHKIDGGQKVDEIELVRLRGRGVLVPAKNTDIISKDYVTDIALESGDIVLIQTGWEHKFGDDDYFQNFPVLNEELATYLVDQGVTAVVLDTPSPDSEEPFPIHTILLGAGTLIVENGCNFDALPPKFDVTIAPMKMQADGAPVRLFATSR